MKNEIKTIMKRSMGLVITIVLVLIAFNAGAKLRDAQHFNMPAKRDAMQASALLKLTPECNPVNGGITKAGDTEDRQLFRNAYNLVKANYVDPITPEVETNMARGAVKGMVDSLNDPENRFMDPSERKLLDDAANGLFYGIGAILTLKKEKIDKPGVVPGSKGDSNKIDAIKIIVMVPMPGSPAEKAGLKAGDSITHIDGKWIITADPFLMANLDGLSKAVRNKEIDGYEYQKAFEAAEKNLKEGLDIPNALEMLTAQSSGEITIKVDRAGQRKPIEVKCECKETYVRPTTYRAIDSEIGYIRVSQFSKAASEAFANDLSRFASSKAKGLILDLRNNPGGLLSSAAKITGLLTGGGKLGSIIEPKRTRIIPLQKSVKTNKPIIVLINKGTASVAELSASCIKEYNNAILLGTKTFGDGLAQTPLILKDGSAAIITTGRMITSSGNDFNGKGIQPDNIVLDSSKDKDAQLEAAQQLLKSTLKDMASSNRISKVK